MFFDVCISVVFQPHAFSSLQFKWSENSESALPLPDLAKLLLTLLNLQVSEKALSVALNVRHH
jgi:hypothetical protein